MMKIKHRRNATPPYVTPAPQIANYFVNWCNAKHQHYALFKELIYVRITHLSLSLCRHRYRGHKRIICRKALLQSWPFGWKLDWFWFFLNVRPARILSMVRWAPPKPIRPKEKSAITPFWCDFGLRWLARYERPVGSWWHQLYHRANNNIRR